MWEALIQSDSSDAATIEILQLLFRAFSVTNKDYLLITCLVITSLVDHLPGGTHHDITDEDIIEEAASVPVKTCINY